MEVTEYDEAALRLVDWTGAFGFPQTLPERVHLLILGSILWIFLDNKLDILI